MAKKAKASSEKKAELESLDDREYEKELKRLQGELVQLQLWVKTTGARAIVVFEGRDAAGKGGAIKRITERVSSRVFRVVALPTPTEREKSQMYAQRYMQHFPAAGEVVLFDRSWYNRVGVERVMGFCTEQDVKDFFEFCPIFERMIVRAGIRLIKYWFDVNKEEQEKRFRDRIKDPRKTWKLSPMDVESYRRWYEYSRARDEMLDKTDTEHGPWRLVHANDKRRARLNCIADLLSHFPYENIPRPAVVLGERETRHAYDDTKGMAKRRWIPDVLG